MWNLLILQWDAQKSAQGDLDSNRAPNIPPLYSKGPHCKAMFMSIVDHIKLDEHYSCEEKRRKGKNIYISVHAPT